MDLAGLIEHCPTKRLPKYLNIGKSMGNIKVADGKIRVVPDIRLKKGDNNKKKR